jgi:hypothetical protein
METKPFLSSYSDIEEVQKKAKRYLGKQVQPSSRKDKKFMVYDGNKHKWIHFGQMGYEDFTRHKDPIRRDRYRKRAFNIKGNWRDNQYSPNNLSINILW